MLVTRLVPFLFAAGPTLGIVLAQGPYIEGEWSPVAIHNGPANPTFTSSVAGELMGFHANDAVVLANGTPILLANPGVYRSAVPLPLPTAPATTPPEFHLDQVTDIAIVFGKGEGGRDALAMVTSHGLFLWKWSKGSGLGESDPAGATITKLGGVAWNGATKLRTGDINSDGFCDILGLMANETTVRCLPGSQSGWGGVWPIDIGARVRDFLVMDWLPGGHHELVTVTAPVPGGFVGGVQVFEARTSTLLAQVALPTSTAVCTTLQGANEQRLVIACQTNGQNWLYVNSGTQMLPAKALAGEATAIATGEWLPNANRDVLLTYRNSGIPYRLVHDGSFGFGAEVAVAICAGSAADNFAVPLLADWHGGGNIKLIYPSNSGGVIMVQREWAYDERFPRVAAIFSSSPHIEFLPWAPNPAGPTDVEFDLCHMTLGTTPVIDTDTKEFSISPLDTYGTNPRVGLPVSQLDNQDAWFGSARLVRKVGNVVVQRWPLRSIVISGTGDRDLLLPFFVGYIPLGIATTISTLGITGDVIQPPDPPDTNHPNPPKPGG